MRYLCIANEGEMDSRALTLLGASVKDGNSPIGMFGSGTKYSLATLIRNGLDVVIFSGESRIQIGSNQVSFRNKTFSVITINGGDTSITTETGTKWSIIHAVREFWSNALDEGKAGWFDTENEPEGKAGETRVYIAMHSDIEEMVENWDMYFLNPNATPVTSYSHDSVYHIEDTNNTPCIFRRGVWCVEGWGELEALFSYNLWNVDVPETRVIPVSHALYYAGYSLRHLKDEKALSLLFKEAGNSNSFEWKALSVAYSTVDKAFIKFFEKHWKYIATGRDLQYFPSSMHPQILVCTYEVFKLLKEAGAKDIRDFRNSDQLYTEIAWPIGYADKVKAAIKHLERNGFEFPYAIKFVRFPSDEQTETIAMADLRSKTCLLTQKAFVPGGEQLLVKALIEEWTHLKHNVSDGTPQQQHVYLDAIVRLMR